MRLLSMVLLLAMLATTPAPAIAGPLQVYTATANGSLTIGPSGEVIAVELESEGDLGEGVLDGFEQRIRAWRFEPITEAGKPVNAVGRMHLVLVAAKRRGESTATFGINRVQFLNPVDAAEGAETQAKALAPPVYPRQALMKGVGARLELLLRLDAEGRPTDVATERMLLLGSPGANNTRLAALFRQSAETAARRWLYPGHPPGAVVSVPLTYLAGDSVGWVLTHARAMELPAWAVVGRQDGDAVALAANGAPTIAAMKLLTPLDPLADADGG